MLLQLLGDEVALSDAQLFFQGVTAEGDDFHAIPERGLDGVQLVGVGEEKHLGKIQGHVQVMVPEGVILFRIKHFQKRCGRVSAHVAADFVHLVQHDDGVHGFHLMQGLHDAAGHGAHIGAPVAADLTFIVDAAQRYAGVFAS